VTGPNTGGKTVVLKTVGLLVAMAQCGLHIPSEGRCVVGRYTRLMVDVGDRQSLYHHLSTFAGHVETLKRILDEADSGALVLLDELGTGTDPEEGAALAMAVLDELLERGAHGVVTTHLTPLKQYATDHDRILNAAMAFDHERLSPTYELCLGESGASLGLTIAGRGGLPDSVVARARHHLRRL
jgi:DNA mismatch repair protein MutS2